MTSPASKSREPVRYATAGVGTMPVETSCAPWLATPRASACSIQSPDSRVSRPTSTRPAPRCGSTRTSAAPRRVTVTGSRGGVPATPRTPSVPNSLLMSSLRSRYFTRTATVAGSTDATCTSAIGSTLTGRV